MLNPVATLSTETERLVAAGRQLAWASGADCDTMEHLIRKVSRKARSILLISLTSPANDCEDPAT